MVGGESVFRSVPRSVVAVVVAMLVLVLPIVAAPAAAGECSRYVSPTGDDAWPGTRDAPWGTLEHAATAVRAGDVVCVRAGTYDVRDDGELRLTVSGTEAEPIIFTTIDGGVTVRGALTFEPGTSHLRIHGLTIRDFPYWGVSLDGDNTDIVLSALDVAGGEASVHLTVGESGEDPLYGPVADIILEDSVFADAAYTAVDCTPGPCKGLILRRLEISGAGRGAVASFAADGLAVERGRDILVEDCYIHDNSGDGIDLDSRDAMRGDEVGRVIVRRNRVERSATNGIKLWRGGVVENNLVWKSGQTSLVLERGGAYSIVNNTFASPTGHVYLATLGYDPTPGGTRVRLVNNIFYNDDPAMGGTLLFVSDAVSLEAGHNLYYNPYREEDVVCLGEESCFGSTQIGTGPFGWSGLGEGSLYGDPRFLDAAAGDFRLAAESPARRAGDSSVAPADDIAGQTRPTHAPPDIGAFAALD